jgi:hypothetical protein
MELKHTPGPWSLKDWTAHDQHGAIEACGTQVVDANGHLVSAATVEDPSEGEEANARLIAAAPELLEALKEARRAIGMHNAPNDCYATGPLTGNEYRDLVECPACSAIAMYDAAIAKATGSVA